MKDFAIHYVTASPDKIVSAYGREEEKYAEKIGIKAIAAGAVAKTLMDIRAGYQDDAHETGLAEDLGSMETMVFYYHDPILSVYMLSNGEFNEMWDRGRGRVISSRQAAFTVWVDLGKYSELNFWAKGQSYGPISDRADNLILKKFREKKELLEGRLDLESSVSLIETDQIGYLSEAVGFPLLLPDDWEARWTQERISHHMIRVSDRR